jgi:hypothetical protein
VEYTLAKQPNKLSASSELHAAMAAAHINSSLIHQSFDSSDNHQTGTFDALLKESTDVLNREQSAGRRRVELGCGLISPSNQRRRLLN